MSEDNSGRNGSSSRVPPNVRKSLLILGMPMDGATVQVVIDAWKRQIVDLHPSNGGDTETAIVLNTAKDCLLQWLESGGPGWGKDRGPDQPSPVPLRPYPSAGDNLLVLPLPKSTEETPEP